MVTRLSPDGAQDTRVAVWAAVVACGAMIAYQVGGKATRDALFLSTFDVTALPTMVTVAAIVAAGAVVLTSRAMTAYGPARLMAPAFFASALLLLGEWALVGAFREVAAVAVYIHFAALGALLISGFWSLINERFDPRTARRRISRIAAGGTAGGILGGLLAERVGAVLTLEAMLPALAVLHLACAVLVLPLAPVAKRAPGHSREERRRGGRTSGLRVLTKVPYLQSMVALVILTTVSEGLIDYVFKARATLAYGSGEQLVRLFALFYTGIAILTFAVQTLLNRQALERLGPTKTVAVLPLTVTGGGVAALLLPGLASAGLLRGAEAILRNSLYRSSYELLYTPIAPEEKRATKTIIDVGFVRLGDVTAAGFVQFALVFATGGALSALVALAVAFAALGSVVAYRLSAGYVKALERSLLARGGGLVTPQSVEVTDTAVLQTVAAFGEEGTLLVEAVPPAAGTSSTARATPPELRSHRPSPGRGRPRLDSPRRITPPALPPTDVVVAQMTDLRSGDPSRVRRVLAGDGPLDPSLVSQVIRLLAWDEVAPEALEALRRLAPRATGQLLDALLDPDEEFAVRRRIPAVLATVTTERARNGLLQGLEDRRFEVRYRCGLALARHRALAPDQPFEADRVYAAVQREVMVDRGVWESQRLLDRLPDDDAAPFVDEYLRDRASRSLEHVFTVLSLVLPRDPLTVAFRGLHTDDEILRGTALEYLEAALPERVRLHLWPFLEDRRTGPRESRPREQILQELMRSNDSIAINLQALRRQHRRP